MMNNSKEHRFASIIGDYDRERDNSKQSSVRIPNQTIPGVFHFGASGPGPASSKHRASKSSKKHSKKRSYAPPCVTCAICMETTPGKVSLKCGHEMCPSCYAMHSRVNNTCPFCRDEFAPKINKPQALQMPQEELEGVAEESVRDYFYDEVDDELVSIMKENPNQITEEVINNLKLSVYCHMYQMSMNTYHAIEEWMEENGE